MKGVVTGIFIARERRGPMKPLENIEAIAGKGLLGDRYATGEGSYNQGNPGRRQVTLIREEFFAGTRFTPVQSRRNIAVRGTELYWLLGRYFIIGTAVMRGTAYCDPCHVPGLLAGHPGRFDEEFSDRAGIVAEVLRSGTVALGDSLIRPLREHKEWPPSSM